MQSFFDAVVDLEVKLKRAAQEMIFSYGQSASQEELTCLDTVYI